VWVFLDLPEEGFAQAVEYWRAVTRTTVSPWRGDRRQFATLLPADGDPWVKVQRVGGPGGIHVDLDVDVPLDEARDHASSVGAEVLAEVLDDDGLLEVVVCRSPGGFRFCLTDGSPSRGGQVRVGQPSLLDQVCLDVPHDRYADELRFWSALTGWEVQHVDSPEFERLQAQPGLPLRFLLQRLDEAAGAVRGHVDLACADRAAEVARHAVLGATQVGPGDGWVVLQDPGGRRYCCTERNPETGVVTG